jgi:hypothetical protein
VRFSGFSRLDTFDINALADMTLFERAAASVCAAMS